VTLIVMQGLASPVPPSHDVVSGRLRPECIPKSIAIEHAFLEIAQFTADRSDREERIRAFQRSSLPMPRTDLLILAAAAASSLEKAQDLRRPFEQEHAEGKRLDWSLEQRKRRIADASWVFLTAYEQLGHTLSPAAVQILDRWLNENVIPTIDVQVDWLKFVPDSACPLPK